MTKELSLAERDRFLLAENRKAYLEYLFKRLKEITQEIAKLKEEEKEIYRKIDDWDRLL